MPPVIFSETVETGLFWQLIANSSVMISHDLLCHGALYRYLYTFEDLGNIKAPWNSILSGKPTLTVCGATLRGGWWSVVLRQGCRSESECFLCGRSWEGSGRSRRWEPLWRGIRLTPSCILGSCCCWFDGLWLHFCWGWWDGCGTCRCGRGFGGCCMCICWVVGGCDGRPILVISNT